MQVFYTILVGPFQPRTIYGSVTSAGHFAGFEEPQGSEWQCQCFRGSTREQRPTAGVGSTIEQPKFDENSKACQTLGLCFVLTMAEHAVPRDLLTGALFTAPQGISGILLGFIGI